MQAIVICSTGNVGLTVLVTALEVYAPHIPVYISCNTPKCFGKHIKMIPNMESNFGDAYNVATDYAFAQGYDSVILANDDVVPTPSTITKMTVDWDLLKNAGYKLGFLGCRSDFVLPEQNIRYPIVDDDMVGLRYRSEGMIKKAQTIAPIFAAVSKEAWKAAKFPSVNWYSDNIICDDMTKAGFTHWVSRGYVHHAGSQTVGNDFAKCHEDSRTWIRQNRPDVYDTYY